MKKNYAHKLCTELWISIRLAFSNASCEIEWNISYTLNVNKIRKWKLVVKHLKDPAQKSNP